MLWLSWSLLCISYGGVVDFGFLVEVRGRGWVESDFGFG